MNYNQIFKFINQEEARQEKNIELIASENFVSQAVLDAMGSHLTNKYAEGYPEQESIDLFVEQFPDYIHTGNIGRYYGGCKEVDMVELYAKYMWLKAFGVLGEYHVNVQPHSGSQANMSAYLSVLKPNDKILAMSLDNGGHLTHGSAVNFSGKLFNFEFYNIDENGFIDYKDLELKAKVFQPKLIVAGASAYSRIIDFERIAKIAQDVGAYFMVDMAHIAGLIVAGKHPSPFGYADIITTTTHKTLRGPRGGIIFCKLELAKKVDSAVFPGTQGGPLMHVIAGKAVAAVEANTQEFKDYINQLIKNCNAMCEEFKALGYKVVTDGTDNHLFLLDLTDTGLTGKQVQEECDKHNITLNKNCIPNEKRSPKETSGVRIGVAAETTNGLVEKDFIEIARRIDSIIKSL